MRYNLQVALGILGTLSHEAYQELLARAAWIACPKCFARICKFLYTGEDRQPLAAESFMEWQPRHHVLVPGDDIRLARCGYCTTSYVRAEVRGGFDLHTRLGWYSDLTDQQRIEVRTWPDRQWWDSVSTKGS